VELIPATVLLVMTYQLGLSEELRPEAVTEPAAMVRMSTCWDVLASYVLMRPMAPVGNSENTYLKPGQRCLAEMKSIAPVIFDLA